MATESTQTFMPSQESVLTKEPAFAESTLLRELSVLKKEVLREVRQDRHNISKKLQELQEGRCLHKVSDRILSCVCLLLCKTVEMKAECLFTNHSLYPAQSATTFCSNADASAERKQVCSSCMCFPSAYIARARKPLALPNSYICALPPTGCGRGRK